MQDIQELKKSMKAANSFFITNRNILSQPDKIAEAIIIETLRLIEEGIAPEDLIFDYQEIYKIAWGKDETPEKASQTVRSHKVNLDALLSKDSELNKFLANENLQQLCLKIQTSTGHHKTTIGIVTNQVNTLFNSGKNTNSVKYFATELPKPYFWTKPFLKIALNLKGVIVTLILVLGIGVGSVIAYFMFSGQLNDVVKFTLLVLFVASIYIMSKFIEIGNKGITSTPIFMTPIHRGNVFFALQRTEPDKLEIITVVYEGLCGMCGDKLMIEKSREFSGRYVGKCAISPKEHVFSFDHITKTGKSLR